MGNMGAMNTTSPSRDRKKKLKAKGKRKLMGGASPVQDQTVTPEANPTKALVSHSFEFKPAGHEERIRSLETKVDTICEDVQTPKSL